MAVLAIDKDKIAVLVHQIREHMENGNIPWHKPWIATHHPHNAVSGYRYTGINSLILRMTLANKESIDPRFCTFSQAQSKGWSIRKGSKSITLLTSWIKKVKVEENEDVEGTKTSSSKDEKKPKFRKRFGSKTINVFHASDLCVYPPKRDANGKIIYSECVITDPFTGKKEKKKLPEIDRTAEPQPIPPYEYKEFSHEEIYQNAEDLITASGAAIHYHIIDKACYMPGPDKILVPQKSMFERLEDFYGTVLHELTHWTGHKTRLDRLHNDAPFGSQDYAKEELVAELASVFLSDIAEVPLNLSQNAAYLQSWLSVLKDDPAYLFEAVSKAEDATSSLYARLKAKEYIPITERYIEAQVMKEFFDRVQPALKPVGYESFADWVETDLKSVIKKIASAAPSHEEKIFKTLSARIQEEVSHLPSEPSLEEISGNIEKFKAAQLRHRASRASSETIQRDAEHIKLFGNYDQSIPVNKIYPDAGICR